MSEKALATADGSVRVLIAGERAITRAGLRRIIDECPDLAVIDETGDLHAVPPSADSTDVLVLDCAMPGTRTFEFLARMKDERPEVPVLVLSAASDNRDAVRTLQAGAAGHITKDRTPEDLSDAIRRVHTTGRYVSRELGEWLAEELLADRRGPPHAALSNQEYRVLCMLTEGRSAKQIAALMQLSPKTVSTYRSRLLDKLGVESNAELIRYGLEHGLGEQ